MNHTIVTAVTVIFALGFYGVTVWALERTRRMIGRSALVIFRHGRVEDIASLVAMWAFPLVLVLSTWMPGASSFRALVDRPALPVVGAVLLLGGLVLMAVSIATLGPAFRIGIDPDQRAFLVRRGPYRHVRHPIYAAFIGFFVGAWFLQPNLLFSIVTPLAVARIVLQARREEQMLRGAFGDAYRAYMATTKRFLPGLL